MVVEQKILDCIRWSVLLFIVSCATYDHISDYFLGYGVYCIFTDNCYIPSYLTVIYANVFCLFISVIIVFFMWFIGTYRQMFFDVSFKDVFNYLRSDGFIQFFVKFFKSLGENDKHKKSIIFFRFLMFVSLLKMFPFVLLMVYVNRLMASNNVIRVYNFLPVAGLLICINMFGGISEMMDYMYSNKHALYDTYMFADSRSNVFHAIYNIMLLPAVFCASYGIIYFNSKTYRRAFIFGCFAVFICLGVKQINAKFMHLDRFDKEQKSVIMAIQKSNQEKKK